MLRGDGDGWIHRISPIPSDPFRFRFRPTFQRDRTSPQLLLCMCSIGCMSVGTRAAKAEDSMPSRDPLQAMDTNH